MGTGDGMIKRAADVARERPTLAWALGIVIAVPSVVTGFAALGINVVPWSGKADQEQVMRIDARVAELERELWQDKLEKANQELAVTPNSRAALRDKFEAEQRLRQIIRLRQSQP